MQDNVRDHRAGTVDHPFSKDAQDRLRVQYARHGRDLVGCKSPVLNFGFFFEKAFYQNVKDK